MCGIAGYIGTRNGAPIVLEGLRRLEYRGYDSAGIATLNGGLHLHRTEGRVLDLHAKLPENLEAHTAIGHTRWATHGEPTERNAHPHTDPDELVAVVHNGIIENANELRARLQAAGATFTSDTDTEVLPHLIAQRLKDGETLLQAVQHTLKEIRGTYGLAVIAREHPEEIVLARNGSPLSIGLGEGEMFIGSDPVAFTRWSRQVIHLDDGDVAHLTPNGYDIAVADPRNGHRELHEVPEELAETTVDGHPNFLSKEIHEQPEALRRTLSGRLDQRNQSAHLGGLNLTPRELRDFRRIKILGCGSAYYAGEAGAQLIEEIARIPACAEPASEWRYRNPIVEEDTLYIAVSQSGETADTLAAIHELQRKGGTVLGVVNAVGSSIARAVHGGVYLHAGPEVSVASTKAYTSMVAAFALLAVQLGRVHDLSAADGERLIRGLQKLPEQIEQILEDEKHTKEIAEQLATAANLMYIGRVRGWPLAREGAQKLKEVTYQHAEAYPASELKHGPLALINPDMPTVAIVPEDELYEKNLNTLQEIRARGGKIIAIGHTEELKENADEMILVPKNERELDPILLNIPLQLLALHAAEALGREVDRPRNLAKSVTVE